MISRTHSWATLCVLALGWIVGLVGCIAALGALIALYFLLLLGVSPGQPMLFDTQAPPLAGALLHLVNGLALIAVPFVLRFAMRRFGKSRAGGGAAPGST
jgi:hypothetical protein